jgi:hypothetical protein
MEERLGGAAPESWRLLPLAKEAAYVPSLIRVVKAPRVQGLTGPMVVHTFVHHQILPLRERAHPLWLH